MRKYSIYSSKYVGQLAYLRVLCGLVGAESKSRREVFRRCKCVCSPVERVAAVIDGATGLWGVVHGAEILPLRGAHFRACDGRARRCVREQCDNDGVDLLREEPTQLVQPQRLVHVLWRLRKLQGHFLVHCNLAVQADRMCEEMVQSFEVLGELEGRVYLRVPSANAHALP